LNYTRSFKHHPDSVTGARHFVADLLRDEDTTASEAVVVMVSELATNCIRHTPTGFDLQVERTEDGIRVEVFDRGDGVPIQRNPLPTEPSGRGLRIVGALADEWGVTPSSHGEGKTVWFTKRLLTTPKPV
jgi:anti-sigma regulatory factor (Ser/Thr protein kinase)